LADDFSATNAEVIAFAESCSEDQWWTVVPGEDWTVGVVLHHIAEGHAQGLRWLSTMARGEAVTDSSDDIHGRNVEHASRCSDISIADTVTLLRENGAAMEAALRQLTDEELTTMAPFGPADGRPLPVGEMAAVAARHPRGHLDHAREAAGSTH
jgi:hypothetical protein